MSPINEPRRRVGNPPQKLQKTSRKWMYIALVLIAIAVIAIGAVAFQQNWFPSQNNNNNHNNNNNTTTVNPIATITTSMGTIKVELFKDKVPNTVDNFIKLANISFYNGLVFHRVIHDFMIQGGAYPPIVNPSQYDPNITIKESPYGPINLEIDPDVHHLDGTIAMARTSAPNSATSQFFIDVGDQPQLEPGGVDQYGYAAFGRVIEGIEVVHAIAALDPDYTTTKLGNMMNWPIDDVIIQSISIEYP
jgi:peptidyl-prolyl cis-trans isomerase B (cyclophilin B)